MRIKRLYWQILNRQEPQLTERLQSKDWGLSAFIYINHLRKIGIAWYYGEILRDRRKELRITQQELAEKVGTARSYIARVEKGETDIQISSFFRIARALGIEFTPTFLWLLINDLNRIFVLQLFYSSGIASVLIDWK